MDTHNAPPSCPAIDDRKSATLDSGVGTPASRTVTGFAEARTILRSGTARQAGFKAELIERFRQRNPPILFQSGEEHRRKRAATARFFAPKIVDTRYRALVIAASDRLVARFRTTGSARLDDISLELAVAVAAEIVGLTARPAEEMARRLESFFASGGGGSGRVSAFLFMLRGQWRMWRFHAMDVRPAIARRRRVASDDVISHLVAEGYGDRAILTECLTYAAAGMATTREFITMAAWHLLERPAWRERYLGATEEGKTAILEEILRLEPVVGSLFRRDVDSDPRAVVGIDIRAVHGDERAFGACPHAFNPDRRTAARAGGAGMAFGDGAHRCPGAGVAILETMLFLDRLLETPGLRLQRAPDQTLNPLTAGYELRGAVIACTETALAKSAVAR